MKGNKKKVGIREITCDKICQLITGLLGIMSVIFNLRNTDALRIEFAIILAASVISVVFFTLVWKKAFYAAGGIMLVYGVVRGRYIIKSLIYFANDVYDTIFGNGLAVIGASDIDEKMAQLTEMLVYMAVLCAWLIVVNIRCIKSMFAAVVLTCALPIIYTVALVIPAGYIWIAGIGYVIGVAAGENYKTGLVSEIMVILVGTFLIFIMSGNYNKPQILNINNSKVAEYIQSNFEMDFADFEFSGINHANNTSKASYSVINSGKLGRQDSIELSSELAGYVITENTGKTQYIKTFTGGTYVYGANRWEADKAGITASENMTKNLDEIVVKGKTVQDMVNNNRNGNNRLFSKHKREVKLSGKKSLSEDFYEIDPKIYSDLYDISHNNNSGIADVLRDVKNQYVSVAPQTQTSIASVSSKKRAYTLSDYINAISYVNRFFENNYRYTLSPGKVPEGRDFVDYFLTESKTGYCSYFASAATLMFRSYGMPARYVEGYMLTEKEIAASNRVLEDGKVEVGIYSKDAHAWVEVYLDGIGWIVVDPTPSSGSVVSLDDIRRNQRVQNNVAANNNESNNSSQQDLSDVQHDNGDGSERVTQPETSADIVYNSGTDGNSAVSETEGDNITSDNRNSLAVWGIFIFGVIVLIISVAMIFVWLLKRRIVRRFRELTESGDVVAIYNNLEYLMKRAGMARPAQMDYMEYAGYMEKNDYTFRVKEYSDIVEKAVNIMYSNGRYKVDADKEMIKHYIGLRNYIYSRMPLVKRIYVMYILAI